MYDAELRMQDLGCRIQSVKCECIMQDVKCRYKIKNKEYRMYNEGCWMQIED